MAKASWCTVTPSSGKGNGVINVSAASHTGRAARSTTVVVTAKNGTKPTASLAVSQAAKAAFITPENNKVINISATGGTFSFTGKSNASKISFVGNDGYIDLQNLQLKINGVALTNGWDGDATQVVAGDPGATAEYSFEIIGTISANLNAFPNTETGYIGSSDSGVVGGSGWVINQAGTASKLSVNKSSLALTSAGTAQSVAITSNDEWTVA